MINFEKKFIFVHIPKTAGTSMEKAPFIKLTSHKHQPIEYYAKFFNGVIGYKLDDFYKFAFVRNPYDRFVSLVFRHVLNVYINEKMNHDQLKKLFTEFVLKQRARLPKFSNFISQEQMTCIGNKMVMDFIGKFENLDNDWEKVCDRFEVKYHLPHTMRGKLSGKYDYATFYTEETKKIVGDYFTRDFDLFDYER